MTALAVLGALAAAAIAALCAAADGALLVSAAPPFAAPTGESSTLPHGDARDRAHRALSIVRVIMHLLTGILGARAIGLATLGPAAAPVAALLLALAIVLVSEAAPRAFGERHAARAVGALAGFTGAMEAAALPLTSAAVRLDARLLTLLPPATTRSVTRDSGSEHFRAIFRTQTQLPVVHRDILRRYSTLGETEVQELMIPRVDIVGIERDTPWSEVVDRVRSQQHSRLPVYVETLDQVAGILFAKDILPAVIERGEPAGGWFTKVRPASFIPAGKSAESQLREFRASHNHLAIVVDEYGGTAGLVTIEDILEEIVGDIRDENDREEPPILSQNGARFWVSGRVTLDELSETLGHHFAGEDVSTVGGLVFHRFGRVPREGEEAAIDGYRFKVERVKRRRVDRVYIEPPPASGEAA